MKIKIVYALGNTFKDMIFARYDTAGHRKMMFGQKL